jgi:hypothetical protein
VKRRALALGSLTLVSGVALAALSALGSHFMAALLHDRPNIRWDASTLVEGDLNGNGERDTAVVGYDKSGLVLAVGMGAKAQNIQYLNFPIGGTVQAAVCVAPVSLAVVPLSCDPDGAKLPGCAASSHMWGLAINDRECDPVNVYWDHEKRRLAWWRN